ncbi:thymidine phosphorylase family protein [uncultured Porticoccus sp.]|uniref:thymidine phosphorylase family protein n=1 Tax=uncultured Porticoccus sp. TaxID=1256050 RepID=UPI00261DE2CE|nr:thymidine phosphorylase family protein [uncultured Porticoccus sp.]
MDKQYLLKPRRLGIDTHQELVVYMRGDCHVCRSEGFDAHSRIQVNAGGRSILATLNVIHGDWLAPDEFGLSESAWHALTPQAGERAGFAHAPTVDSMSAVRAKIYGNSLGDAQFNAIVSDVCKGFYTDVELATFLTACASRGLDHGETVSLTRAMINVGERLNWHREIVVDKHCVGGLPGNRTTPLVVAMVAAEGLVMPKTSSRAITSPAGTADTMETLAPVALSIADMRRVVEREGGCIAWGGAVSLSPADDILIRIERAIDLDSEGQLVASVLSKKAAAGATHVVLDLPVGPTAKVRSESDARRLGALLRDTGEAIGLAVRTVITDGMQPVGRGIGPALEARDVLAVLQNKDDAPADLRERSLQLAGAIFELAGLAAEGSGTVVAAQALISGRAWRKFQAICEAQGGMRTPPSAAQTQPVPTPREGVVSAIDNRVLARIAKLAGAPGAPAAGLDLHVRLGDRVEQGQPLFTLHTETTGELAYALEYLQTHPDVIRIAGDSEGGSPSQ